MKVVGKREILASLVALKLYSISKMIHNENEKKSRRSLITSYCALTPWPETTGEGPERDDRVSFFDHILLCTSSMA